MKELLERGAELDQLAALLTRAAAGEGGVAVVEGPAGIGKSRLLAATRQRAEERMMVLSARGGELEGEFAFGVVRQLLEAELARPERRAALLDGPAAPAAKVFGAPDEGDGVADDGGFAALHGLFWLVAALADERPLLLLVDDLHWCDRPSLRFLSYLGRRIEGRPLLLLVGLRDSEPGSDTALLAEIAGDPQATVVRPGPLSRQAVVAFVEERLDAAPDQAFAAACHDATGGNPLLLDQLAIALRSERVAPGPANVARVAEIGPRAVSRTVLRRLARLPEPARAVARAVSLLGQGAELAAVAALAAVDEAELGEATRALTAAGILRGEPPLAFVHPLVRDAVYHELSPAERDLDHARAAALLRDRGAPIEQVAAQLLQTQPRQQRWAAELLWEVGRAAMRAGAADSAVAYLRRALDELPADGDRGRLLFELGTAEVLVTGELAADHLARAYDELTDPQDRATAAVVLGRALVFTGAPDETVAVSARAARDLPPGLDDFRLALQAMECMAVYFGASGAERLERLREHRTLPERPGPGARMLASMAAWVAVCTDGVADECAGLAFAALGDGELNAADSVLISFAAMTALTIADRPEACDVFEAALAEARRNGSLLSTSSIDLWYGFCQLRRGDLAAAEASLRAADDEFTMWGHDSYANVNSRSMMGDVLRERGRLDEAAEWLARVGDVPPRTHATGINLGARAALALATGDAEAALELTAALGAHCDELPDPAHLWWRSMRAEALDRLDRRDEALALTRAELERTRAFGAPSPLGRTLRVLGTLEREDGIDTLREAVAALEGSPARLEHAKALAALGTALRLARRPTDAREPLRQALAIAGACGAEGLADHVRSELYASGARPRRDALSGIEALTPSERRVAALAAAGRTNREIAQELYVTPKTIELHLTNAYRKLGVRSRRELDPALAEAPLAP